MKQQINEHKKMQQLAGLIKEMDLSGDPGFEQWKQRLYMLIIEDGFNPDEKEIQQYYKDGKTPENVYFKIWDQNVQEFLGIRYSSYY